jgi:Trypsin-like peptidase domain
MEVKQGDSVYALGAPRGQELSLTNGIVSGFRESDGQFLIQTTAAIAPGSSGGPLFDSSGRVIGVTTSLLSDSPGIYFSVAATDVVRLLRMPEIILPLSSKKSEMENRPDPKSLPPNPPSPDNSSTNSLYVGSRPPGANIFRQWNKAIGPDASTGQPCAGAIFAGVTPVWLRTVRESYSDQRQQTDKTGGGIA